MFLAVLMGIPAGIVTAIRPKSFLSKSTMSGSLLGISLPVFWLGIMLVMIFSVILGWLPSSGSGETAVVWRMRLGFVTSSGFVHLILPALTIAIFQLALIIRLVRAGMMEVLLQDFVNLLKAKGLSEKRIVFVHALKNILIPVVTMIGLQLGNIIAFAIVTESIFAWPGMGKLVIDSIHNLGQPVVLALWGQGLFKIIVAISVVNWVFYARTARGSTLSEREKDYVDSARAVGASSMAIMLREILPNIVAPIIVIGTVRIANAIILESTLSFLGLGVPITEPSLGSLIYQGYQVLFSGYWWISVFPGFGVILIGLGIKLLGDRLRDVLNPRLKR